jgi:hypothetical protein
MSLRHSHESIAGSDQHHAAQEPSCEYHCLRIATKKNAPAYQLVFGEKRSVVRGEEEVTVVDTMSFE